jgi:peptide/nickel transport system permease protein
MLLLRRTLSYPQTRIGLAFGVVVVGVALLGPLFAPHSSSALVTLDYGSPSSTAPLGGDYLGEDVLSQVLDGGRSVLWMAVSSALLGVLMGVAVGLVAGYARGWLDSLLMRVQDVVLAFPQLVFVMLFVALLGPKEWLIVTLVAIGWVPGIARLTRGITMEATTKEFVQAAEVLGYKRRSILFGEVLPTLTTPLMVELGLRLTWSIAVIAGLSFLGLGVQAPAADWGLMVNKNYEGVSIQPWAVLVPMLLIAMFAISANLVTEGFARAMAGIDRRGDT